MELITRHRIYYSNRRHVPIADIAESLLALESIIKQSPSVLEKLFPGTKIEGLEVYLSELRSGSLHEDILIKLIFGSQEKFNNFIHSVRERFGLERLNTNNELFSAIILIMVLAGGYYYLEKSKGSGFDTAVIVENNINVVINNSATIIGVEPHEFRSIIEDGIHDKEKLAKDAIKFIKPAKRDEGTDITFDENRDLSVNADTVKVMPRYLTELEPEESIEDYERTEITIRATDLDSFKRGWAAIIPEISDKRVKLQLDPHIKAFDLMQHPTIIGNVTVIFKIDGNGNKTPSLYFLRQIHEFVNKK